MPGPDGQVRGVPESIAGVMANLAQVWHWPPSDMWAMPVPELMHWHALALDRNKPAK